jgi:hypothetical protein
MRIALSKTTMKEHADRGGACMTDWSHAITTYSSEEQGMTFPSLSCAAKMVRVSVTASLLEAQRMWARGKFSLETETVVSKLRLW